SADGLRMLLAAIVATTVAAPVTRAQKPVVEPPSAAVRPVTDDYHGTTVSDAYRWMEDANRSELDQWMKQQNEYARNVLERIALRNELLHRIQTLSEQGPDARRMQLAQGRYYYLKRGSGDSAFK